MLRPAHAPALRGRAIRQTECAETSARREELSLEEEPRRASSPERAGEELLDVTYKLPQPQPGRVWIAADALFDTTIHGGVRRPTLSWPASDLGGRSADVVEAVKRHVAEATWKSIAGSELRVHGEYAIFARTTRAVQKEIWQWLHALNWSSLPTRHAVDQELAWMLSHGTPLEREWAHEALAWIPATSRDQVEDILERDPPPSNFESPQAGRSGAPPKLRIRVKCRLIRSEHSFFRDIGIDVRGLDSYWHRQNTDDHFTYLDDLQWEAIERHIDKSERTEKLTSRDTVGPNGSTVRLVLGEHAVLHLRMTVSEDRRYISMQGRVHARDGNALLFAPHFKISMPDEGSLLISVRDVISGEPAREKTLGILLRAWLVGDDAPPAPEPWVPLLPLPETDWVPVQPEREP